MVENEKKYVQSEIYIDGEKIPLVIDENEEKWYSAGMLSMKVLKKPRQYISERLSAKRHIKSFDIKYTPKQPMKSTKCISEVGLIEVLVKINIKDFTVDELERHNILHRYLGIQQIHIPKEMIDEHIRNMNKKNDNLVKDRKKWTVRLVIEHIQNRYRKELSLNSATVQKEFRSLHDAALKRFGSWEEAISASGYDYDEIRSDKDLLIVCGHKFEAVLRNILTEIHGHEIKKGVDAYIKPDYIISEGIWADAKLSLWTSSIPETIDKYKDYCDELTIIFLRGNKKYEKKHSEKTLVTSVYRFIKRNLAAHRHDYYFTILNDLYREANEEDKRLKKENKKKQDVG